MVRRALTGPAQQLRLWVGLLCIAWGILGFIGGTWFGTWRSTASAQQGRPWYEEYADHFAREFYLSGGQKSDLLRSLENYDREEKRIRAGYALEMERQQGLLRELGWGIAKTVCDGVLDPQQREEFMTRIAMQRSGGPVGEQVGR